MTGSTLMVYTQQCGTTLLLALILKNLGFRAIPIISYMSQAKKLGSLNAFKSGECNILLCSDFVSKGLDIPAVDMVINYDIPWYPNDYIYRVGWTVAHVNVAISFVSPDERRHFNMIEKHIGKKLPLYPAPFEEVLLLEGRAIEAERLAQEPRKGGQTFISLLDMSRPFKPMKDLDMDKVIQISLPIYQMLVDSQFLFWLDS